MHVIREESNASLDRTDTSDLETTLLTQYDTIGSDIRGLLQEWENGKSALISSFDRQSAADRFSRPSSLLTPMSPTPSLSGATAVEGDPSDALKALNGESQPDINTTPTSDAAAAAAEEEEIFEAVALPPRSKRASLTRDERIARVKEDRAKQAAAREKSDAGTNMLRELEMVIKQRPSATAASKRVTSI